MTPKIITVIMSGGSGTRLWPLSTPSAPKQFHALGTERTLIQETALRLQGDAFTGTVVICGVPHLKLAQAQLKAVGIEARAFVVEPVARNTAAVAAIAALVSEAIDPDALVLLVAADHVVTRPDAFASAVLNAATEARDHIVTFGIRPTHAETGYGYIERGAPLSPGVFQVRHFLEKPNAQKAEAYVADGGFDWNAGIFMFAPETMLGELQAHAPDVLSAARKALDEARRDGTVIALDPTEFSNSPSISVDYAVMERTSQAAVAPCDIGWADVGSFEALWQLGAKDDAQNHVHGKAILIEAHNNLVHSAEVPVAIIGLNDIMVVATDEGILVAPRSRSQDVKLAALAAKALQSRPKGG